jgi:hypothetical protein
MADVSGLKESLRRHVQERMTEAMGDWRIQTQAEAPVRTGDLARSIDFTSINMTGPVASTEVFALEKYAVFQDSGTRGGYVIVPVRAKMLHWVAGGMDVFRRRVIHPGVPARHFFMQPLAERFRSCLQGRFGG